MLRLMWIEVRRQQKVKRTASPGKNRHVGAPPRPHSVSLLAVPSFARYAFIVKNLLPCGNASMVGTNPLLTD
jgi:hypothetical protein